MEQQELVVIVGFLLYAVLFRLAVIAAGIVSIILGYKLFLRGVMSEGGTNINAQAGQISLTLANAAPGSIFAVFGASIITAMLFQGNPELLMRNVKQLGASQSKMEEGMQIIQETQMKGGNDNKSNEVLRRFEQTYNEGVQRQRVGDIEAAIAAYNKALAESDVPLVKAANVFNELAWLYREQHRIDAALVLARIATTIDQKNSDAFDTLALILLEQGEVKAAEQAAEAAISLDNSKQNYQKTLQQVRAAQKADNSAP